MPTTNIIKHTKRKLLYNMGEVEVEEGEDFQYSYENIFTMSIT